LVAERQAAISEERLALERSDRLAHAAQQDIIAVNSMLPILRAVRAEIARFNAKEGLPSEALIRALETMQDGVATASSTVFNAELRDRLDALRSQAELTSKVKGIARVWKDGFLQVEPNPNSRTQYLDEGFRRRDALRDLDNLILIFLESRDGK
jgi:hypothetical protein